MVATALTLASLAAAVAAAAEECGIWFAPSTVPGAGMGLFAGRAFPPGDIITRGDLGTPLVDFGWHNMYAKHDFLWDEYTWSSSSFNEMDQEGTGISAASPGVGAIPNCFFPLINADESETEFDYAGLHRSRDPGAGAITPYYGRESFASRHVAAGEEVFVDYGENYFISREDPAYGGPMAPLLRDYLIADHLVKRYSRLQRNLNNQKQRQQVAVPDATPESCAIDVFATVKESLVGLMKSMDSTWQTRVLKAIPDSSVLMEQALEVGTAHVYKNRSIVSHEYLAEKGLCMDNLNVANSDIPQAGRGAFAKRHVRAGQVVAPLPVLHVHGYTLNMYAETTDRLTGLVVPDLARGPVNQQLLHNYCFGHAETSILLCPYGVQTSFINHASPPATANVRLQWSHKASRRLDWMEQPIEVWAQSSTAGLALELIATRDIAQDEEILLDYGQDWQNAWNQHVQSWQPPAHADAYVMAHDLNENVDLVIGTLDEADYVHSGVNLHCRSHYLLEPAEEESHYPCHVARRWQDDKNEFRYMAVVNQAVDDEEYEMCYPEVDEILWNVPRDAFLFEDLAYARDHAQPWAFRHYMGLPDELLPAAWRDVRVS